MVQKNPAQVCVGLAYALFCLLLVTRSGLEPAKQNLSNKQSPFHYFNTHFAFGATNIEHFFDSAKDQAKFIRYNTKNLADLAAGFNAH